MPKFIKLTSTKSIPVFVNFENIQTIEEDVNQTILYGTDGRLGFVKEKAAEIIALIEKP